MEQYTHKTAWPNGLKTLPFTSPVECQLDGDDICVSMTVRNTPENWVALRQLGYVLGLPLPGMPTADGTSRMPSGNADRTGKTIGQSLVTPTEKLPTPSQAATGRRNGRGANTTSARANNSKADQPTEAAAA